MNISDQINIINKYLYTDIKTDNKPFELLFLSEVATYFLSNLAARRMMHVKVFLLYESSGWLLYVYDRKDGTCFYIEPLLFIFTCDIEDAKSLFEKNVPSCEEECVSITWLKITLTFGNKFMEEHMAAFEKTDNQSILTLCDKSTSKCYRDNWSNWYMNIHRDFLNSFARLNVCGCTDDFERDLLLNVVLYELAVHRVLSVATFRDIVSQLHGLLSYAVSLPSIAPRHDATTGDV
jgi:hypothetical protein